MKIPVYQVDSFTDHVFSGNPAAVCPLGDTWLADDIMQNIAKENNLSETAFYICKDGAYHIRWFTPATEVDLCGHATLATAFVHFFHEGFKGDMVEYGSRSGILSVKRSGDLLTMNFPEDSVTKVNISPDMMSGLSAEPIEAYKGKTDLLLVFEHEKDIRDMTYDLEKLNKLDARGIIVTAKGTETDFVSRFFAPRCGIAEDPVTGSAHTTLTQYWSAALGKKELTAAQLSERGGTLWCRALDGRVEISGKARLYLKGEITI